MSPKTAMATTVPALQLESILNQQSLQPIYLLVGEEDLLRDHALAQLKAAVLGESGDFNYDLLHGDEAAGSDVVACAGAMPVFAPRRLVVVKSAEKLSARESDALLDYLKRPVETTTLVFVSAKLDGRLKFSQALAKAAVTVDCSPLRDAQWTLWLKRDAARLGVRLGDQAVQLLKEMSGGSLYAVRRELEKLQCYLPADRPATGADVLLLRGMEPGASVFDLTAAISQGARGRALAILARNLEAGEAPLRVLGSLAWQYRRLWKTKELLRQGGRDGEAARTLRMEPQQVRSFLGRFSEEHLRRAPQWFLEADDALKGGSPVPPRIVLERVLLRLCECVRPGGSHQTPQPRSTGKPPAERRVVSNVRPLTRGERPAR